MLELVRRPNIATHSSAYELRGHHRNLTDERLNGIAAGTGVVNVNFFAGFLGEDPAQHTVARLVDHIQRVASIAGVWRHRARAGLLRPGVHGAPTRP